MSVAIMTEKFVNWEDVPVVLDTEQVAELLNVHINTIKVWTKEGNLPSFKMGRARRFHKADVMRFIGLQPDEG